jgi:hypothetical protein
MFLAEEVLRALRRRRETGNCTFVVKSTIFWDGIVPKYYLGGHAMPHGTSAGRKRVGAKIEEAADGRF